MPATILMSNDDNGNDTSIITVHCSTIFIYTAGNFLVLIDLYSKNSVVGKQKLQHISVIIIVMNKCFCSSSSSSSFMFKLAVGLERVYPVDDEPNKRPITFFGKRDETDTCAMKRVRKHWYRNRVVLVAFWYLSSFLIGTSTIGFCLPE